MRRLLLLILRAKKKNIIIPIKKKLLLLKNKKIPRYMDHVNTSILLLFFSQRWFKAIKCTGSIF